jgi:hypothetical protein
MSKRKTAKKTAKVTKKKAPQAAVPKREPSKQKPPAPPPATKKAQAEEVKEQLVLASPDVEVDEEATRKAKEVAEAHNAARVAELKRLDALGLCEVPVRGTPYTLVGMKDPAKEPSTIEQRVEMAKRLNAVGPLLPRYVRSFVPENPPDPQSVVDKVIGTAKEANLGKEEDVQTEIKDSKGNVVGVVQTASEYLKEKGVKRKVSKRKSIDVMPKISKSALAKAAADIAAEKASSKKGGKSAAPAAAPKGKARGTKTSMQPLKVPPGGFNKTNVPATSGELIRARITEHKLNDEQIASEVRKLFPGRNTQVSDVRWNRGQMRKHGIDAPDPVGESPQPVKGKKK